MSWNRGLSGAWIVVIGCEALSDRFRLTPEEASTTLSGAGAVGRDKVPFVSMVDAVWVWKIIAYGTVPTNKERETRQLRDCQKLAPQSTVHSPPPSLFRRKAAHGEWESSPSIQQ